ncbi:HXXEE domain-containing protein [Neobacillus drentensis]|uniref:HXXEE domain-containing protein n=1 Tax=Neobacillus drentensis TaxID=220684 RepID=UPI002FFF0AEE
MLDWVNSKISLETLIWLFPITFLLHDFEEIIFVESWFKKNYAKLEPMVPKRMKSVFQDLSETTAARFSIPVFMQFIVYIVASYLAVEQQYYDVFLGLNVLLFLHVFTHLGQSALFRCYALGVGTALLITLPYSLYLFYRLLNEAIIGFDGLIFSLPYGLITILIVWFGHKIAPKILPNI